MRGGLALFAAQRNRLFFVEKYPGTVGYSASKRIGSKSAGPSPW